MPFTSYNNYTVTCKTLSSLITNTDKMVLKQKQHIIPMNKNINIIPQLHNTAPKQNHSAYADFWRHRWSSSGNFTNNNQNHSQNTTKYRPFLIMNTLQTTCTATVPKINRNSGVVPYKPHAITALNNSLTHSWTVHKLYRIYTSCVSSSTHETPLFQILSLLCGPLTRMLSISSMLVTRECKVKEVQIWHTGFLSHGNWCLSRLRVKGQTWGLKLNIKCTINGWWIFKVSGNAVTTKYHTPIT